MVLYNGSRLNAVLHCISARNLTHTSRRTPVCCDSPTHTVPNRPKEERTSPLISSSHRPPFPFPLRQNVSVCPHPHQGSERRSPFSFFGAPFPLFFKSTLCSSLESTTFMSCERVPRQLTDGPHLFHEIHNHMHFQLCPLFVIAPQTIPDDPARSNIDLLFWTQWRGVPYNQKQARGDFSAVTCLHRFRESDLTMPRASIVSA
ncbi:hypothetical protein CALVIDRAFT_395117 [Calocera viscosa TUFC12733]|uniref:Uncharacterized protein n=1 Tax=Calocera viscosa (strain TUFC12733) TaxID=1330018 RepID=A0A167GCG6_CALVF|nr:hypothetical protein CALVIDRAFT_395117 [Calocera viscosa TUFC12733]